MELTRRRLRIGVVGALLCWLAVQTPSGQTSSGGNVYIQETAPATAAGLALGYFWLKQSTGAVQVLTSLSPVTWVPIGGGEGGAATWGTITGTLSAQTDLQSALDAKAATSHTHTIANVTSLQTALDGKALASHAHAQSEVTNLVSDLAGKAATGHTHAGVYEPANANLQAHVVSAHAPAGAQVNADITKAEIEAKLTGVISSHSHAGGGAGATVLRVAGDVSQSTTTFADVTGL